MSAHSSAARAECADGDGAQGFVDLLARERRDFALPSRLRETAERFAADVLALLFPHFGAGAGTSASDVAAEHAALRRLLVEALALPGSHASEREATADRFLAELPAIRDALQLDAHAICEADPAAQSVDEVVLAYPGFLATGLLPDRARPGRRRLAPPAPHHGIRPPRDGHRHPSRGAASAARSPSTTAPAS